MAVRRGRGRGGGKGGVYLRKLLLHRNHSPYMETRSDSGWLQDWG